MQLIITDEDFRRTLGTEGVERLTARRKEDILGPENTASVLDALPRVIAARVKRMIPEDYEMLEITLKVALSGTPFGVGVAGDATIKFGPKKTG